MMNLLRLIGGRTASAPVARERLQIPLAHDRGLRGQPDLLGLLRVEILAVVSRHIVLDPEKVIGASMSRRLKSILRCLPVSRDQMRSLLDDRRQRHPLARIQLRENRSAAKALEIARSRTGVARLLTNATWPAVVA
jgi:cell division topological specificity factor MinE